MKIIVSTKAFANYTHKAILGNCKNICIFPHLKELRFPCKNEDYTLSIEGIKHETCTFAYTFNPIQMYRLMVFLEQLQEQPIVIEFDQYTDNDCSIKLTQFEHSF